MTAIPMRFKIKHLFRRCIEPWCWQPWHHMQRCDEHVRNGLVVPPGEEGTS